MCKHRGESVLVRPAVAAGLATTFVFLPLLAFDGGQLDQLPLVVWRVWWLLLLTAAPVGAYLSARRSRWPGRAALAGVPQVVLLVALIWLNVWLEVRSGYLLADSGEEEMAYQFGTLFGVFFGLLLAVLVPAGVRLGRRADRRSSDPFRGTSGSTYRNVAAQPGTDATVHDGITSPRDR